jgi:hypothetical protein
MEPLADKNEARRFNGHPISKKCIHSESYKSYIIV